MTKMAT